jgi:cysteine-rich repeat protein
MRSHHSELRATALAAIALQACIADDPIGRQSLALGPPYPTHCAVGDDACAIDPAVARTQQRTCTIAGDEDTTFSCEVELGRDVFEVQYHITHPAPLFVFGGPRCVRDWVRGSPRPPTYPVVLIAHGAGQDHTQYDYLLEHLALNGFIAISMSTKNPLQPPESELSPTDRADIITQFVTCLERASSARPIRDHWDRRLGLLGHSRGGEAVVLAARELGASASVDLDAVLSLAPANEDGTLIDGSDDDATCEDALLTADDAPAYLVVNGSRDEDTDGRGLGYYDRAGSEFGGPHELTKSMVWVYRASHNGFLSGGFLPVDPEILRPATQQAALRAYANAFFRAHIRGHTEYDEILDGSAVSAYVQDVADGVGDGPVEIYTQYSLGRGARHRVIDNSECPDSCDGLGELECWQNSSAGGPTLESVHRLPATTLADEVRLESALEKAYGYQRTRASIYLWNTRWPSEVPKLWFDIPAEEDPDNGFGNEAATPGGLLNDVRFFTHLSFRAAQIPDAVLPVLGGPPYYNGDPAIPPSLSPLDFHVELVDMDGAIARVRVSDHGAWHSVLGTDNPHVGTVQYPDRAGAGRIGHLQTIRIPLRAFCSIDLTRLARVRFVFDERVVITAMDERYRGAVALDSIEFTAEPDPRGHDRETFACNNICGDGVLDAGEECDDGNLVDDDDCTIYCEDPPPPGGGGPGGGDCAFGDPGCPGGPCLEEPLNEGHAAHDRLRFCREEHYVCRPDPEQEGVIQWTCHDCTNPEVTEFDSQGCPCHSEDAVAPLCPGLLTCYGEGSPFDSPEPEGACWDEIPEGFCEENCATCDRVCSSADGRADLTECVSPRSLCDGFADPDGDDPHCEPQGLVCDPVNGDCQAECIDDCDCFGGLSCVAGTCT